MPSLSEFFFSGDDIAQLKGQLAVFQFIGKRNRIASALEADGIDVHDNITAFADNLAVALKVSGISADLTGIQADAEYRSCRFCIQTGADARH